MKPLIKHVLTGKLSYRKKLFSSKLVLQVEVQEKVRLMSGVRFYPAPLCPPPPGHPDPEGWNKQMEELEEKKWLISRTFIRDASERDMRELSAKGINL